MIFAQNVAGEIFSVSVSRYRRALCFSPTGVFADRWAAPAFSVTTLEGTLTTKTGWW